MSRAEVSASAPARRPQQAFRGCSPRRSLARTEAVAARRLSPAARSLLPGHGARQRRVALLPPAQGPVSSIAHGRAWEAAIRPVRGSYVPDTETATATGSWAGLEWPAGRGARRSSAGIPPCPRPPCCCWRASSISRSRSGRGARSAAAPPTAGVVIYQDRRPLGEVLGATRRRSGPFVRCQRRGGDVGSAQQASTALMRFASAVHSAACAGGATNRTTLVNALSATCGPALPRVARVEASCRAQPRGS